MSSPDFLEVTSFNPLVVSAPKGDKGDPGTPGAKGDPGVIGSTATSGFMLTDPADGSTEWNFYRAAGATNLGIYGSTGFPAILTLYGPNDAGYADFTFNGFDTEIDSSVGNISLRPLTGGNVNIWAMSGTPKLRVGSTNMTQSLDLSHDGTNAHLNNTATGYIGLQGDKFQVLETGQVNYNGPTTASATAGTNGAPPAQVAGYLTQLIGGVTVHIPYYF